MALTKINDRGLETPIDLLDNEEIRLGTGNDLKLYHNGSHSYISSATGNFNVGANTSINLLGGTDFAEYMARFIDDGAVELYHNGDKKLETNSGGCTLTGTLTTTAGINAGNNISLDDSIQLKLGTDDDVRVYHNGADLYIDNDTGGTWVGLDSGATFGVGTGPAASPQAFKAVIGAQVELYHNNTKRVETTAYGTKFTNGRIELPDESGHQIQLGAIGDFVMEHDGSNTYLGNITGDLVLQNDASVKITAKSGGTQRFRFDSDGLKFGTDSAAANALDDYEEGTWTPRIQKYSGSSWVDATMTDNGTVQQAKYTKIGNIVQIYLFWNGFQQSDANYCALSGLPFTSNGGGIAIVAYNDCFAQIQNQAGLIGHTSNNISFYYDATNWNAWSTSSARTLYLGAQYHTS